MKQRRRLTRAVLRGIHVWMDLATMDMAVDPERFKGREWDTTAAIQWLKSATVEFGERQRRRERKKG